MEEYKNNDTTKHCTKSITVSAPVAGSNTTSVSVEDIDIAKRTDRAAFIVGAVLRGKPNDD